MNNFKIIKNLINVFAIMQKRSKGTLFWIYFFPVFIFIFLGYIFGNTSERNIQPLKIGFDSKYQYKMPSQLLQLKYSFNNSNLFKVIFVDKESKDKMIINNKIYAFITYEKIKNSDRKILKIYLSEKNKQINAIITSFIDKTNLFILKTMKKIVIPYEYKTYMIKKNGITYKYIYFLFAGMIAISLMQNSFFSIPSIIVSYRKMGFLKRFLFTPLKKSHFTISLLIQRFITGIIQTFLLFLTAFIIFKISFNINILSFIISFIIGSFTFSVIGFFLAGVIQSEETTTAIGQILNMVLMFTSGVYFPIEILPKFFLYFAYTNPIYHFTKILYSSILLGQNLTYVYINLLVLCCIFILFFILTLLTFKYEKI